MQTTYTNWNIERDDDQIVSLMLDKPDTSTNVLSQSVLMELQAILNELKNQPLTALVFQSNKENCFIAGADVKEFSNFQNASRPYNEALQAINKGQHVMNLIENLNFPTFSLINGHCLGGGMELALACDYRIALDNSKTRMGLPEVKLGIHPGFGGTVRSTRLLGVFKAMGLMLSGRTLSVYSAKKSGLIDDIISNKIHHKNFNQLVNQWLNTPTSDKHNRLMSFNRKHKLPYYHQLLNSKLVRLVIAYILNKKVRQRVNKLHYPAPFELIKLWKLYAHKSDLMMQKEAASVAHLITSETAQNLIRIFNLQNQLKSLTHVSEMSKIPKLKHIHIIGGGVMGGDIAIESVYKGFSVTVHDQSNEVLARLMQRATQFFSKKFKQKHLIQAAMDRLIPDIKNDGLRKADLVIEAIIESVSAKQSVFKHCEEIAKADCIFATNTSSIPLDEISTILKQPSRLIGIHFFNPVSRMPLIEVVSSSISSEVATNTALHFAGKMGKLPLPVTSTPGFLVNRVLTPYLLEAMELFGEGVPALFIDKAAKEFGMPMGPIELADKVGLDICLSVTNNLAKTQNIVVPEKLIEWVEQGHLGIKTQQGFYAYKNGQAIKLKQKYYGLSSRQVSDRLMFRLFNEAVACLEEKVVANEDYLDAGIIFGTGFAPFLGGPMHYIKHQGIEEMDHTLIDLSKDFGPRFNPSIGWNTLTS